MSGILIFAGTYEGRTLCEYLSHSGVAASVCVATEYGAELLHGLTGIDVICGRLDARGIAALILEGGYGMAVDATHPYAGEVTANIAEACKQAGIERVRLLREEHGYGGVETVKDTDAAVEALSRVDGNALITTGSKELERFTALPRYAERLYVRVLPSPEVLSHCYKLGFTGEHVIAMQGPFSFELNTAILRRFNCRCIVTKNTGAAGGVEEKVAAAEQTGAKVIMIDRPLNETGCSLEQTLKIIGEFTGKPILPTTDKKDFFPLFISSRQKRALVVGGGKIAARRVKTLLKFNFAVRVVAPVVTAEIKLLSRAGELQWLAARFDEGCLDGADIVIAATDDRAVNKTTGVLAKERGLPVSVSDCAMECSFYFPAVVTEGRVTAGIVGDGKDHAAVSAAAKKVREALR